MGEQFRSYRANSIFLPTLYLLEMLRLTAKFFALHE